MGIVVRNISKCFQAGKDGKEEFLAVDNVSFQVPKGHLVALLGPSGSGKSTILRIIAGLEEPDSGDIFLQEEDVTLRPAHERGIGFVFQHYALFKHMTVWKNIAFGLEVRKRPSKETRERVEKLLELVQLKGYEGRYPAQLSGGQRQRVALARALAPYPNVLLLDEPFGALDAKVRRNLASWLRRLHDEVRITSVFVTHDQEEAFEIADEIVLINRGKIEQIGIPNEIYDHPSSKFVASFIGHVNVLECHAKSGGIFFCHDGVMIPGMKSPGATGEVVLLIRPENVDVSFEHTSDRIPGRIMDIRYRGDRYEIDLEVEGLKVNMRKDKVYGENLNLSPGQRVFVRFNRCSVFESEGGHAAIRAKLQSLGYIE
jgi:sulfate transport system ATP-binding protein